MDEKRTQPMPLVPPSIPKVIHHPRIKIGLPAYRVDDLRDSSTGQRGLLFEIEYPQIQPGLQPRHRFMSAFEQKVQAPDKNFQYLIFAAAPYENIAFKIPNKEIDKGEGTGIGLNNLSERYRLLTGKNITVIHNGKEFTIILPLTRPQA